MALTHIDLNADLGETEGDYLDLLNVVSSANVACGAHAGGGELLRDTVAAAIKRGVQVGAHPSYQDRENFGRVSMRASITEVELREILIDQVNQVKNTLIEFGSNLSHIKAHGALYNDAMVFADTANVLCNVAAFFEVPILGLPGSTLETQAQIEGVQFIAEGFLDRAFTESGRLVPRSEEGAVLNHEQALEQAKLIVLHGEVKTNSGAKIKLPIRTVCVHADTAEASKMAHDVKVMLEQNGVEIVPFSKAANS